MYLRQYSKLPFYDGFEMFRRLKMLNPRQHNPLIYAVRPPETNLGYPLREEVNDTENQKVLNKLMHRYPDLKYAPLVKEGLGENQNEGSLFRFLKLFNTLRKKGYHFDKAFEKAEMAFQAKMQRKIDQTKIANNLAITNQARSFMTLAQQEIEFEQRLKRDRLLRDLKIQEFEKNSPLDPETQALMDNYKKSLIKVVHHDDKPEETTHKQDEETFTERATNVFNCYYNRVATQDKLNGLSDKQILQNIRQSPSKIKNRLRKYLKVLQHYNVTLDDDAEFQIPEDVPENLRYQLEKGLFYITKLYDDIDFEYSHHEHLDTLQQELEERLKEQKQNRPQVNEDAEFAIKKVLQDANIKAQNTYSLFETPDERLARLQIKWLYRKIDEYTLVKLKHEDQSEEAQKIIDEKIDKLSNQAQKLVENLRVMKLELEYQSFAKTGKQLFQEHAVLLRDKELFVDANKLQMNDIDIYFKIPVDQRRLTQAGQVNDDIIHNLIKVQNLKSHVARLNHDDLENRVSDSSLKDETAEILKKKILAQFKLLHLAKKEQLKGKTEEDQILESKEDDFSIDDEAFNDNISDNLEELQKRQREARLEFEKEKALEAKQKEDELKSQQAIKGQKGSKKKKAKK
ncbi:unnamed protein product [Paramecium primaurelia]|uniref:Uncharacterized protein n=1 Tax=Paramecium primaurelia TaxID=5886 RepID=A0A8S1KUI5_PARPR|nr:unnamed protein product [Paramecium primaurelia]